VIWKLARLQQSLKHPKVMESYHSTTVCIIGPSVAQGLWSQGARLVCAMSDTYTNLDRRVKSNYRHRLRYREVSLDRRHRRRGRTVRNAMSPAGAVHSPRASFNRIPLPSLKCVMNQQQEQAGRANTGDDNTTTTSSGSWNEPVEMKNTIMTARMRRRSMAGC
jgi:hypothetical protein